MKNFIIYATALGIVGAIEAIMAFFLLGLIIISRCSQVMRRTGVTDWTREWQQVRVVLKEKGGIK